MSFTFDPFEGDPLLSERSGLARALPGPRRRRALLRQQQARLDAALAILGVVADRDGTAEVRAATVAVLQAFHAVLAGPTDVDDG